MHIISMCWDIQQTISYAGKLPCVSGYGDWSLTIAELVGYSESRVTVLVAFKLALRAIQV